MDEFYGTVEGYKAYHLARDNDVPASDDDEIKAGLLVASEWLDATYGTLFSGSKIGGRAQSREWPRSSAYDRDNHSIPRDETPREVVNATYEAAAKHLAKPGCLSVDYTPNKYKSVAVDGAVNVTFNDIDGALGAQNEFVAVTRIMSSLLSGSDDVSSLSGSLVRA